MNLRTAIKRWTRQQKITNNSNMYNPNEIGLKCPACKSTIWFERTGKLHMKVYTEGITYIKNFLELKYGCPNPACEWSEVRGEQEHDE